MTTEEIRTVAHDEAEEGMDEEVARRLGPPPATEPTVEMQSEAFELDEEEVKGESEHFDAAIITLLNERLDRKLIKVKPGGERGLYLEAYTVINHLNRIFGYGSWSRSVDRQTTEAGPDGVMHYAVVTLTVRGTDGTLSHHQDEGALLAPLPRGETDVRKIRQASHRTARLGAISDGLKRAARSFGEQFANSLYDKSYMATRDQEERAARAAQGASGASSGAPTLMRAAAPAETARSGAPVPSGGRTGVTRAERAAASTSGAVSTTDRPSAAPVADDPAYWAEKVRRVEARKLRTTNDVSASRQTYWSEVHGIDADAPALEQWSVPDLRAYGRQISGLPDLAAATAS